MKVGQVQATGKLAGAVADQRAPVLSKWAAALLQPVGARGDRRAERWVILSPLPREARTLDHNVNYPDL